MRKPTLDRQSGSIFFEIALAIALLTVGILAFLNSFLINYRAVQTIMDMDAASASLASVAEELSAMELEMVHSTFNGKSIPVPELLGPDGQAAVIRVICHVSEGSIPPEFGPVADIDGSVSRITADASTTYKILPVELTLTYVSFDGLETREMYMILYSDKI